MSASRIQAVAGRCVPIRGHDIDTDRIIPARFLRAITFDGLEAHVFEDDRQADPAHPFNQPRYQGAAVLLVGRNFGCGSSREHAPQALKRWGIQAIVGEGYSEIFFGNAVAIGLPCLTVPGTALDSLMAAVERDPATTVTADVARLAVEGGGVATPATMARAAQEALVTGLWDGTGLLLDRPEEVRAVAGRLPYLTGFRISD